MQIFRYRTKAGDENVKAKCHWAKCREFKSIERPLALDENHQGGNSVGLLSDERVENEGGGGSEGVTRLAAIANPCKSLRRSPSKLQPLGRAHITMAPSAISYNYLHFLTPPPSTTQLHSQATSGVVGADSAKSIPLLKIQGWAWLK